MKEWLDTLWDTPAGWVLSVALGVLHLWRRVEDRAFDRFERRLESAISWNEELEAELEDMKTHAEECERKLEILEKESGIDVDNVMEDHE